MTIAEQIYNRTLEAGKNGEEHFDTFEYMEELTNSNFDSYRTTYDDGDVIGFADGSFYSFDDWFTDGETPHFENKTQLLATISEINEAPWDGDAESSITGIVTQESPYINCLMLTETTENGEPAYWDTDDRNDYQVQQVLVEYTSELAKLIGKMVTIAADTGSFSEQRFGSRGGYFHVKNFFLTNIKVVEVEPQLTIV